MIDRIGTVVLTIGDVTTPTYDRLPSRLLGPAYVSTTLLSMVSQAGIDRTRALRLRRNFIMVVRS
jgi:hypothetical protein